MMALSRRGLARAWFLSGCLGSALLVATTFLHQLLRGSQSVVGLGQLDLSYENVVASWYAGMLLLIVALHALDGHDLAKLAGQQREALSWLVLTVLILILSIDEVASFHERTNIFAKRVLGLPDSVILVPFELLYLAALGFALSGLYRQPQQRPQAVAIAIAFGVFVSVPLQEKLDDIFHWESLLAQTTDRTAEEATELLGSLILLWACLPNTPLLGSGVPASGGFVTVCRYRNLILTGALLAAPVLAIGTAWLPDQGRGHPADWSSAALFLLAGIAILAESLRRGRIHGWSRGLAIMVCGLASATTVATAPLATLQLGAAVVPLRPSLLAALCLVLSLLWPAIYSAPQRLEQAGFGALVALFLAALLLPGLTIAYAVPQLAGALTFWLVTRQSCGVTRKRDAVPAAAAVLPRHLRPAGPGRAR